MAVILPDVPVTSLMETSHGTISYNTIGTATDDSPTLLFIHGNSFSSQIFKHFFSAKALHSKYRLISFDLPGHGLSSNARAVRRTYTMPGYANATLELLSRLRELEGTEAAQQYVVVGWSLGGHIAMEMLQYLTSRPDTPLSQGTRLSGILLVGAPPVNNGEVARAFTLGPDPSDWRNGYAARADLSSEEMDAYAHVCADPPYEGWMGEAVARTHQIARRTMFQAFAADEGETRQRDVVEKGTGEVVVGVVNGKEEPWVNLEWVRAVKYRNLWRGECIELEGLKHAPFWARPEEFVVLLGEFVSDVMNGTNVQKDWKERSYA